MIRIGLVDDDKEHQKLIRQFICRYEKEEQTKICVKEYTDGLQFLEEYEGNLDVVFLDIEMPHMDGMTAARKLREKDTGIKIIFVTNMAQYAIHGYEVDAVDFIVKPISYYVFVDKLKKALRYLNLNKEKMVVVHGNGEMMRIGSSQILYVEKDKNYLVFHTTKGNLQARGTMLDVEKELSQEGFSKCINGCLVNLKCVSKLEKDTVWIDEIQLLSADSGRKSSKKILCDILEVIFHDRNAHDILYKIFLTASDHGKYLYIWIKTEKIFFLENFTWDSFILWSGTDNFLPVSRDSE